MVGDGEIWDVTDFRLIIHEVIPKVFKRQPQSGLFLVYFIVIIISSSRREAKGRSFIPLEVVRKWEEPETKMAPFTRNHSPTSPGAVAKAMSAM